VASGVNALLDQIGQRVGVVKLEACEEGEHRVEGFLLMVLKDEHVVEHEQDKEEGPGLQKGRGRSLPRRHSPDSGRDE